MASASVMHNHQSPDQPNKSSPHVQPRRRIQVACSRCRKRKIRCSGDTGNGQGCTNCKSSGTSSCIFVRVNSSLLQPGTWPYVLKSADSPPSEVRRGSWESQTYSRANSVSMHSASQMSSDSSPVSPSDFDYGAASQSPSIYHRGSYSSGYPITYEDTTMTYGVQAPSYMIPNGDTSTISNLYATQTNLRGWHSSSQALKPSNVPLYCDQDTSASLGFSFATTTPSQTPVSADSGSMLGISTGLSSGLGGDRILPTPVSSRNTSNSIFPTNVPDTLTALNSNGSQTQNYKISQLLSAECHLPSQDREGSRMTSKTSVPDDSSLDGKGTTMNPPRDVGFGYMQTADMADSFQTADPVRSRKDDSLYSSETCTSSAYEFGSPISGKGQTLTSGHAYTQLIHPQTSHNSTMLMRANAELASVAGTTASGLSSNGSRQAY